MIFRFQQRNGSRIQATGLRPEARILTMDGNFDDGVEFFVGPKTPKNGRESFFFLKPNIKSSFLGEFV